MKMLRIVIFLLVALVQLAVPGSVVWKRARTLSYGRIWKFKTEPVDPIDAVRGRYVALRLAAEKVREEPGPPEKFDANAQVYLKLKEDVDGFAQVEEISPNKLTGDNIVQAKMGYWSGGWQYVKFPFDRFWVAEKNAPAAESAYLENSRRGKENAYVTVRVRDGDAALEQLYIDNQPLADYLRTHAAAAK